MRDRARSEGILGLLSQKAAYQTVRFLAAADTGATQPEISAAIGTDARRILRSLAIEGFVSRDSSWDLPADDRSIFTLTPRGWELVTQMARLDAWARARQSRLLNSKSRRNGGQDRTMP